jgi:putative transposase
VAELFQNKYRVPSARKVDWDYGADAAYFITICVNEKQHEFGEIVHHGLVPTPLGEIAEVQWLQIPDRFPYALLDAHVIMPNHMHGILIIDKMSMPAVVPPQDAEMRPPQETRFIASLGDEPTVQNAPSNKTVDPGGITGAMNPMLTDNVSRVVRWYKGRSAFEMHKINPAFRWQARFWDRIIRNEVEYERIRNYILNNPAKWPDDKFYTP